MDHAVKDPFVTSRGGLSSVTAVNAFQKLLEPPLIAPAWCLKGNLASVTLSLCGIEQYVTAFGPDCGRLEALASHSSGQKGCSRKNNVRVHQQMAG